MSAETAALERHLDALLHEELQAGVEPGALARALAEATDRIPTLAAEIDLRRRLVRSRPLTMRFILAEVCSFYDVPIQAVRADGRVALVAKVRKVAMYLCRALLAESYPSIGRAFHRDHTTVIAACERVRHEIAIDPAVAEEVDALRRRLTAGTSHAAASVAPVSAEVR